jgi:hypothetical protein
MNQNRLLLKKVILLSPSCFLKVAKSWINKERFISIEIFVNKNVDDD